MTLQLYVLRRILFSFAFSLGGILLLVFPTIAVQAVERLRGVDPTTILGYLPLVLVDLVPYLLPMAFLLALVATFGGLAADRELTAIRTAGIHPGRLLLPGLAIALPLCAGTYWALAEVTPQWKYAQHDFVRRARERAFKALGHGVTELELGDFFLKAERQDPADPGTFYGVLLSVPESESDEDLTVFADRIHLGFEDEHLLIDFDGFQVFRESYEIYNQSPSWRIALDELFPHEPKNPDKPKYMTSTRIRRELSLATPSVERLDPRELAYELQRRRALSVTYLLFLLLGVPTGIFLRSGTQLAAFTGAVGYAFLYYVLALRLGKELANAGAVSAFVAAWTTNGLFLLAGALLSRKALWR